MSFTIAHLADQVQEAKMKLVDSLEFCKPFWIARFGDFIYLFDFPSGRPLGRPILSPEMNPKT